LTATEVAEATRVINAAYDNGINFFDVADIYGYGRAEAALGAVLRQSAGLRNKVVVQSKCGIRFQDEPQPDDPYRTDFSREHILRSVEGSLRRLGMEHLDILLLHRPDALVEPEEVASAFDELHRSGKVRYFGVSNQNAAHMELLKKFVRQPLVANQVQLGLAHPYLIADGIEANREDGSRITHGYTGVAGTLDYCRLHDIQIQAYSPLRRGTIANPVTWIDPPANAPQEVKQAAKVLADIAKNHDSSSHAVALAWLLRHPARIVPVIGASSPENIADNCAADKVQLSREQWYTLFAAVAGVSSQRFVG
jgi:predicted oxidoreductase